MKMRNYTKAGITSETDYQKIAQTIVDIYDSHTVVAVGCDLGHLSKALFIPGVEEIAVDWYAQSEFSFGET